MKDQRIEERTTYHDPCNIARAGRITEEPREILKVICKDFVDMVLDEREPPATPLAGRMSVAAGVCAACSLRNGGVPVDVPPAPKGFR